MAAVGKLYGSFVVEGALADSSETVLLVRHRGDAAAAGGVVKTILLPRSDSLQPGVMAVRRLDVIALQDRVASDWPEVAPILDRPTTREQLRDVLAAGEAWFVIPRYEVSLQKLLAGSGGEPLDAKAIWLICRKVVRGALAFQQVDPGTGRRSHGNLKLANVLLRGLPLKEGQSEIVVTDPAPGGRSDLTPEEKEQLRPEFEKLDLEALGQIIFQLVAARSLPDSTDWGAVWNLPEGNFKRWKKVFGANAKAWVALCREMLEVRKGSNGLTLVAVEKRLAELPPPDQHIKPPVLAGIAAGLLILAAIAFFVWKRSQAARLTIEVALPSADVLFYPQKPGATKKKLPPEETANGVRKFFVRTKPGLHVVEVIPTGEYTQLPPVLTNLQLAARSTQTILIHFDSAQVQLASEPSGAEVFWRSGKDQKRLGVTPLNITLPPDDRFAESEFQFVTNGYGRKTIIAQLAAGTNVTLMAALSKQQVGSITADFRCDVDQGRFRKTRFFVEDEERTSEIVEVTPGKQYAVTIVPPRPWPEINTNIVFAPEPLYQSYLYSPGYGTLVLKYKEEISTAIVWLWDQKQEKLGIVANEVFRLPEGKYTVLLELDGYLPTNYPVVIQNSQTKELKVHMDKFGGN